jgi:methyl-accepting chemotaxis protein
MALKIQHLSSLIISLGLVGTLIAVLQLSGGLSPLNQAGNPATSSALLSASLLFISVLLISLTFVTKYTFINSLSHFTTAIEACQSGSCAFNYSDQNYKFENIRLAGKAIAALLGEHAQVKQRLIELEKINKTTSVELRNLDSSLGSQISRSHNTSESVLNNLSELDELVTKNREYLGKAQRIAEDSQGLTVRGRHVLKDTMEAMSAISDSSQQISEITNMIDSIAFETNLLALNAAVEAARAGDQGRGFAVVASEVRNLAQRSAGFAKEIKTQIDSSVLRVNAGVLLAKESGVTLTNIVNASEEVNRIINNVADITNLQEGIAASSSSNLEEVLNISRSEHHLSLETASEDTPGLEHEGNSRIQHDEIKVA